MRLFCFNDFHSLHQPVHFFPQAVVGDDFALLTAHMAVPVHDVAGEYGIALQKFLPGPQYQRFFTGTEIRGQPQGNHIIQYALPVDLVGSFMAVDVEQLAIDRACRLFGADHANVQAHSGANANTAVYQAVLEYGDTVKQPGLNLLSAPGNDLVASTALAAAGAQIILFTTGRGTPFASPVPTIKISSNSRLYNKKTNWSDFNAGELVDDEGMTLQQIGMKLYDLVMETASGKPVKAEQEGYHDLAIFKKGVTL